MTALDALESETLWRRIGLAELRTALAQVTRSLQRLQQGIRELPPCDGCARAQVLQKLHAASRQLSQDSVGISMLTEALKAAVSAAEQAQAALTTHAPAPCRCPTGPCTCHE